MIVTTEDIFSVALSTEGVQYIIQIEDCTNVQS